MYRSNWLFEAGGLLSADDEPTSWSVFLNKSDNKLKFWADRVQIHMLSLYFEQVYCNPVTGLH